MLKKYSVRASLLIAVLGYAALPATAQDVAVQTEVAQDTTQPGPTTVGSFSTSPWQLSGSIYGWLPRAPVDITTRGHTIHMKETLKNILKSLQLTLMAHFEAEKGPVGFFVSPVFYKGKYTDTVKGPLGNKRDAELKEKAWLVNYGVSYNLGTFRMSDSPDAAQVTIRPFVGGSYFHDPIEVSVEGGPILPDIDIDKTVKFNTPIIGVDTRWKFNDKWGGRLRGHYGGFNGISDVEKTWEAIATISYHTTAWNKPARWFAGYRYTNIQYDDGDLAIDVDIKGPLIGFGLEF